MRATSIAVAASAALLLGACGSSQVTLHGVFIEAAYAAPGHGTCAQQEAHNDPVTTWRIKVTADNVDVGTAPVHWSGRPNVAGCVAKWHMTVPPARDAYRVSLLAVCDDPLTGDYGTETITSTVVQPKAAGPGIGFDDVPTMGSHC